MSERFLAFRVLLRNATAEVYVTPIKPIFMILLTIVSPISSDAGFARGKSNACRSGVVQGADAHGFGEGSLETFRRRECHTARSARDDCNLTFRLTHDYIDVHM
jgi:hypothetical protein